MTEKIITEFVNPPIPDRQFDWSAVFAGYEPGDFIGRGRTEQDAIAELRQQVADEVYGGDYIQMLIGIAAAPWVKR